VCHYEAGAYYHAHHDGVDMTGAVGKLWAANGGQRLVTLLIYINDVPRGGKTLFNELNLYSKPQKGSALLFLPRLWQRRDENVTEVPTLTGPG